MKDVRSELIHAGFKVCMQPIYKEITVLDAKYDDVKSFLDEHDYHGGFVVIGKTKPVKVEQMNATVDNDAENEQLSFF